jgi:hypothetical protein
MVAPSEPVGESKALAACDRGDAVHQVRLEGDKQPLLVHQREPERVASESPVSPKNVSALPLYESGSASSHSLFRKTMAETRREVMYSGPSDS